MLRSLTLQFEGFEVVWVDSVCARRSRSYERVGWNIVGADSLDVCSTYGRQRRTSKDRCQTHAELIVKDGQKT